MDSDQGKLFIGGISWETTDDRLKEYFGTYGIVSQTVIMRDKVTGRPRGFGFVVFQDPNVLDAVLADKHNIDGRTVEAKRALSRDEQHTSTRPANSNVGRVAVGGGGGGGGGGANVRTNKIFVGGLPPTLTDDEFRQFFSTFGDVEDVVVMYDQNTNRPRGFGFITFTTEDAVDTVLQKTFHELKGKLVEVKRALPKELNSSNGGNRQSGGGSYQTSNTSSYEASRYAQPQAAPGGYPAYGSSGYGASGYGYGAANNGAAGYGGYGAGGYGATAAGYGGLGGAYGNPNAQTAGYVSGPPGAPRSPWSNQAPTGYSSAAYGANTGYGAAPTWNAAAGTGGGAAAPTGQSPSGAAGYGSQGYGYGGYGGAEGSYGNQGGYGAVGGRGGGPNSNPPGSAGEQGASSGYMSGGYGDATGSAGYPNWRSDPTQSGGYGASQVSGPPGGPAGYGSGYGAGQPRQAQ